MGFSTAVSELALVLFTTLAPAGAIATIIMAIEIIRLPLDHPAHYQLDIWLWVPLAATMVGLIAASAHLGNPSNALYTVLGFGSSPLSNEVVAAVIFLAIYGFYWLYAFAKNPNRSLQRVWLVVIIVFALLFIYELSAAYSAETIITWNTVFSPATIILMAIVAGSILALLAMFGAWARDKRTHLSRTLCKVLLGVSVVSFVLSVICHVMVGLSLANISNSLFSATELVPGYWIMLVAYVVLMLIAIIFSAYVHLGYVDRVIENKIAVTAAAIRRCFVMGLSAYLLASVGVFIMRFAFYMMHMTVGLSAL